MRIATLALGFAVTSCASPPPPAPVAAPAPEEPAARVVWSVPIVMENGVPVITAQIRDGETKFAIATGTSNHTLTKSFATAVRAPVSATRQSTTVNGVAADVETVEGVVSIKAANAEWRLQKVVALETDALDPRGIGGLLSPQALATNTTTVVLDFKSGALTLVEGDAALFATWFAGKFGDAQKLSLQRAAGLIYVDAKLGSAGAQRAKLDTASPRSRFAADALGVKVGADACVDGADLMAACLPGAATSIEALALGSTTFPGWEAVGIVSGDPTVGADILSNCVIAIGVGNDAHLVCR